jgi:hypothetical protein
MPESGYKKFREYVFVMYKATTNQKMLKMNRLSSLFYLIIIALSSCSAGSNRVMVYPAPDNEPLNEQYHVSADGVDVPVYNAKIGNADKKLRETAMDNHANSHLYYDVAGFASFDLLNSPVEVSVTVAQDVKQAKILPASAGITPVVEGKKVSFKVEKPCNLTVEINGEHVKSLHLFVNPEETDKPSPDAPGVVYFGPGVHELTETIELKDNQTLYIAGGALIRCANDTVTGSRTPSFVVSGSNVKVLGRGIIDQENVHRLQPRNMMVVNGDKLLMNGVILRNSCVWTLSLRGAQNITIDNVKIMGHRANSDGIDVCESHNVLIENCFIRTLDDLIVVKTFNGTAGNITARQCVLWNEVAHALSIGAELRYDVDGVTFTDCDIIGDHCREWSLRIFHCDNGVVRNIRFENIRIDESVKFISLWINSSMWTKSAERGHIENVVFKDINLNTPPAQRGIELLGFDADHAIRDVTFDNVTVQGKKITDKDITANDFVYDIKVQ